MEYGKYKSEKEYHEAIEEERKVNPDTFHDIVLGMPFMTAKTGLNATNRDFELRYGRPLWKRYGVQLLNLPIFPAGMPLTTTQEIITYRNKGRDSFILKGFDLDKVEDEIFRQQLRSNYEGALRLRNFRDAYNYSMGKTVNVPHSNINIKADSNGIPQLQKWK